MSSEEPTYESRSVPLCQRDRVFRKHHGWVRIKRCGFCYRGSHIDELGITGLPMRVDRAGRRTRPSWYCCVQCANHLDTRQAGWARRAPFVPRTDAWDYEPEWMVALRRPPVVHGEKPPPARPEPPLHMRMAADAFVPEEALEEEPCIQDWLAHRGPIADWAEDGDLRFGSL